MNPALRRWQRIQDQVIEVEGIRIRRADAARALHEAGLPYPQADRRAFGPGVPELPGASPDPGAAPRLYLALIRPRHPATTIGE